ncbi:polysaccharide deacetylase family protein [Pseudorhodoferax sp.]|uniref:polysaccharide deacetylase family protein n=1 Tax=Pseudorhodoferax sp. TaxID=1993553 RepID=UPI002DD6B9C0|nr:polysaccharide deacetylase family protein [Pseudorhodoferax sp.]
MQPSPVHDSPPERVDLPAGTRWPGGRHLAVVFNIAYEAWSGGATSGVGPMGNPLPQGVFDHNADSYGRYGAKAGIRRLLGTLRGTGVPANVFVSGMLAADCPQQVADIVREGHEIVAHGFAQNLIPPCLSPQADEDSIQRSSAAIAAAAGMPPRGWISPRATSGSATQRRLLRHGYRWHADTLDADAPYLQRFAEGALLAIPLAIEFNDLSHSMRFGRTPRQFVEMFADALPRLLAARDDLVIVDVLAHAHCYGRPASAWAYQDIVQMCAGRDDIWVTTRDRIADHLMACFPAHPPAS